MSSSDLAISVRGVSKAYTIRHQRADTATTLAEAITRRLRNPFRRQSESEQFWALKDVSFDVKRGEVVGIIGRNGAGKSTLLKILSRITEMTTGEVDLYGRVGSLLEVGTGFHQELTGRENIFLNGAILGMTRAEIKSQFDAIVDFAGVEKFLDTPVKRYSSGMYVRLAFAVAAHLRSEILIVDEVLAVGDAEFQKKCLGKMKEVSTDGRTVLFVSHNIASILELCSRAILLQTGSFIMLGPTNETVHRYVEGEPRAEKVDLKHRRDRTGTGDVRTVEFRICDIQGNSLRSVQSRSPAKFVVEIESRDTMSNLSASIDIDTVGGQRIATLFSLFDGTTMSTGRGRSVLECTLHEGLPLNPGIYSVNIYLGSGPAIIDFVQRACVIEVRDTRRSSNAMVPLPEHGALSVNCQWRSLGTTSF